MNPVPRPLGSLPRRGNQSNSKAYTKVITQRFNKTRKPSLQHPVPFQPGTCNKGQAWCIYVWNWTLCKPLVVQFPCDSGISVFARILKGQRNTRGTKPRKPLRDCDREIAYLYYYIRNPRKTVIRHTAQRLAVTTARRLAAINRQDQRLEKQRLAEEPRPEPDDSRSPSSSPSSP